jgi:hypothetical protein
MNKEILEEKVYYYTNVIEDPKKLVEAIESKSLEDWTEWASCSGKHYVYGENKQVFPTEDPEDQDGYVYRTISKAFYDVAEDYGKAMGVEEPPKLFNESRIKKYSPGTSMGAHFDQQEGDGRIRYSLVMYLNDDYEGGELSFTITSPDGVLEGQSPDHDFEVAKTQGLHSFYIKPKAGSVIIFPSTPPYHHTAHLVKSGFKYMVPQHWIK